MRTCRASCITKVFALLCVAVCGLAQAAIPPSERAVLDAIYTQTNGASWTTNTDWEGAIGTECSWFGIACTLAGDHVTVITLGSNNLTGSIPSLAGLTNLTYFFAVSNKLTGSIPSLAGMTNLQQFYVADNQLTGSIPSLAGLSNLQQFYVFSNQLTGSIPSLSGLTNLQAFFASGNQLTGGIPSLTGLSNLQAFAVGSNQLTGSIPALTGLSSLQIFEVTSSRLTGNIPSLTGLSNLQQFYVFGNQLTGSIPDLTGLPLQDFQVGNNGLTGDIPTPPASLIASGSSLCNNALNHVANPAWDAATGMSPWYSACTSMPSTLTVSTNDTTVATGTSTTITAAITTPAIALMAAAEFANAANNNANYGTVTITDSNGGLICYIALDSSLTGSCTVVLPSGTTMLTAGYSGTLTLTPTSAQFSKTNPVTTPGNLDQHGWTGAWYNHATGGQGLLFEIYPDLISPGVGYFGGAMFTYDTTAGGEDHKRWYTLTGNVSSISPTTTLNIVATGGGNFNAGPIINTANGENFVGHATLNFADCTDGNLSYSFTDGSGRLGSIPLTRLDSNVTCNATNGNGNGTAPGMFLLSGAWYDRSTSGQGLLFDINPAENVTFAAWYTYAPNGQTVGGGASQRWYTLQLPQLPSANAGTATLPNIPIYSAQGGVFNAAGGVTNPQEGSANITFADCNHLALSYSFTSGSNSGLSSIINLVRVGPAPAGCSL